MPQDFSASPLAQEWKTILESNDPRVIVQFFRNHAGEIEAMGDADRASLLNQRHSRFHHSALGCAIVADPSLETAKKMISLGADVDSAVNGGINAFLDAPDLRKNLGKHRDLVKILLEKGVDEYDLQYTPYPPIPEPTATEEPDKRINSEFIINLREWAAKNGHADIMRMLLERDEANKHQPTSEELKEQNGGINVPPSIIWNMKEMRRQNKDQTEANNIKALSAAITSNHLGIAQLIDSEYPELLAKIGKDLGYTPMHLATSKEMVEWLHGIKKGLIHEPNLDGKLPIHSAAINGHKGVVEALIAAGADINAPLQNNGLLGGLEETLLHNAARNGNINLVKLILECGGNINAKDKLGRTPLFSAAEKENPEMLYLLLDSGANINAQEDNQETLLHRATGDGQIKLVELLLKRGAKVDIEDWKRNTPIDNAASLGRIDVVELLLDQGRDINTKNNRGDTLLDIAVSNNQIDLVKTLLNRGANVHDADINIKATPLLFAYSKEMVEILIASGADVNGVDLFGNTALHILSRRGSTEHIKKTIDALIEAGADINVANQFGATPLDDAIEQENPGMIEFLKAKGAKRGKELKQEKEQGGDNKKPDKQPNAAVAPTQKKFEVAAASAERCFSPTFVATMKSSSLADFTPSIRS